MDNRRTVLTILDHGMDAAQKRRPSFRSVFLSALELLLQRYIGCNVDLREAGNFVIVARGEAVWINIQEDKHPLNGDLTVEFFKHKHILPVITVKGDSLGASVICDTIHIVSPMLFIAPP